MRRKAMASIGWRNAVTWSLLGLMFLLFALVFGAAPALAWDLGQLWLDTNAVAADTILYEVTEDMFLKDAAGNFVTSPVPGGRRMAVAQLSGWSKLGTPLCPTWVLMISPTAKKCAVNAQVVGRSEEHTSELQSPCNLVCRLLLEKKKKA